MYYIVLHTLCIYRYSIREDCKTKDYEKFIHQDRIRSLHVVYRKDPKIKKLSNNFVKLCVKGYY